MHILHFISGIVGVYLVYLTFVMTESTEGIWINRLEELWIQVDERNKSVGETTRALFSTVADKVSRVFNRIFGVRLISLRAIGTSGSLSFACFFITLGIGILFLYYLVSKYSLVVDPRLQKQEPLLIVGGSFGIGLGLLCLTLAFLPMVLKSPFWVWLSCVPTGFWLYLTFRLIRMHLMNGVQFGLSAALASSFASDVFIIILIRQSLRSTNGTCHRSAYISVVCAVRRTSKTNSNLCGHQGGSRSQYCAYKRANGIKSYGYCRTFQYLSAICLGRLSRFIWGKY
jgi:hypothetical protein